VKSNEKNFIIHLLGDSDGAMGAYGTTFHLSALTDDFIPLQRLCMKLSYRFARIDQLVFFIRRWLPPREGNVFPPAL
jgi:hypothetical protein